MAMGAPSKAQKAKCPACLDSAPADQQLTFSFGESTYTFEGCDRHVDQLQSDLFRWTRISQLVEDHDRAGLKPSTKTLERPKRSGSLAYRILPEMPVHVVPEPEPRLESAPPSIVQPRFDSSLPINHDRWTLTDHAQQRMTEREVSRDEIVWCAEHPDVTRDSIEHPGCKVHKRGSTQVVVNPVVFRVLTVWDARVDSETELTQELEYQNAS